VHAVQTWQVVRIDIRPSRWPPYDTVYEVKTIRQNAHAKGHKIHVDTKPNQTHKNIKE